MPASRGPANAGLPGRDGRVVRPPAGHGKPLTVVVLRGLAVVLALAWAAGNWRVVPDGEQAVTRRLGRAVGVQSSGLVLALPWPVDSVVLVPGSAPPTAQTLSVATDGADRSQEARPYLTGDGGVVTLGGSVTWRVADPVQYAASRNEVPPILRRLFLNAAVSVAAGHGLDAFVGVEAEDAAGGEARRVDGSALVLAMNRRLAALQQGGAGLGVEVLQADVTASLPQSAQAGIEAARAAARRAGQSLASARAEAARTRQQADRESDALAASAKAGALERVAAARSATATIVALETRSDRASRPALLDRLYRERIAAVLAQARSVDTVDAKSVSRLILPGAQ